MKSGSYKKYISLITEMFKHTDEKNLQDARENIVFFVSFPKSGRTWLQLIMARIYSELTGHAVELFLDSNKDLLRNDVKPYPFIRVGHGYKNSAISQGEEFPQDYYRGQKAILMVRDPRDVVVSHYYHEKYHYKCFEGTISDFIRYKYDTKQADPGKRKARFGIMPIINYMNAWQNNIDVLDDCFLLTYEDMKKDSMRILSDLCHFLDLPINEELLAEVIDACSFKNMRKIEEGNELEWNALELSDSKKGYKTRKGKAGGYVDELSGEDIAYIEKHINDMLDPAFSQYIYTTNA